MTIKKTSIERRHDWQQIAILHVWRHIALCIANAIAACLCLNYDLGAVAVVIAFLAGNHFSRALGWYDAWFHRYRLAGGKGEP